MRTRSPDRINHTYVNKLFAALDEIGFDPAQLPREFLYAAWEDKAAYLLENYGVHMCPRCKLPKLEQDLHPRLTLCLQCHATVNKDHSYKLDPRARTLVSEEDDMGRRKPFMLREPKDKNVSPELRQILARRMQDKAHVDTSETEDTTRPPNMDIETVLKKARTRN